VFQSFSPPSHALPSQQVLKCGSLQFLTQIGSYERSSSLARTGKPIWGPRILFFGGDGVLSSFLGADGVEDCGVDDGGEA